MSLCRHLDIYNPPLSIEDIFDLRIQDVEEFIFYIIDSNLHAGKELLSIINKKELANTLSNTNDILSVGFFINYIFEVDQTTGKVLWSLIDKQKLANIISQSSHNMDADNCINKIFDADPIAARELLALIDKSNFPLQHKP